jgi:hypothetical protein
LLFFSCWLKPNPFLGAFVGPACLAVLIDIIMFIRLNNLALRTYDSIAFEKNAFTIEEDTAVVATDENLPEQIASKCELIQHLEEVLPAKNEVLVYQKGSLLVLLMILVNFKLAFLLVWFQHSRYLNVALSCAYAVANITLGLLIFLFHCFKNKKAKQYWVDFFKRNFWKKKYVVDQGGVENTGAPHDKVTTSLLNGDTVRGNGAPNPLIPRINGAPPTPVGSDIQSNVSVQSSAALTVDIPIHDAKSEISQIPNSHPGSPPGSDKHSVTASMSDRQSCVSAPLPLSHAPTDITKHPPGYRNSYCVPEMENNKKKSKKKKERIPLAMPERNLITSSRESSMKLKNEENSSKKPSQNSLCDQGPPSEIAVQDAAPSEQSSRGPGNYIPYSSCASSDVSLPCDLQPRPPIPGASDSRDNTLPTWPGGRGQPNAMPMPPDHYPRPLFGPVNFNYPGNVSMQPRNPAHGPYPKTIPEERYVALPQRVNGVVRHRPQEHVYESINEPQHNGQQPITGTHIPQPTSYEQIGPNRPGNGIPYPENHSLLPPSRGAHLNGPTNDNLPRKRPRRNSDKSRTRRNREGGSQPKRRDVSSRPPHRSSASSSLKADRVKPEPKEWVPDPVPRLNYVPVPHFPETADETRNETSV